MKKRGIGLAVAFILIFFIVVGIFLLGRLLDPYRLPPHDWWVFRSNFITPEGRVMDTGNEKVSHSEGQGYGMLIAVAYGDRAMFERIWGWTQKNLQTRPNDKLLSWLWKPSEEGGGVADPNNATDGDLLVAWALVRAFDLWKDAEYQKAAGQILADLSKVDIMETEKGLVFLPGTDGFVKEGGITLNPSYYVFPALASLEKAFPGAHWGALGESGEALIKDARFGKWELVPDWVLLAGTTISLSSDFPPLFGYNAVRVPLHIAWQDPASELLKPFADYWKQFPDPAKIPATVNLQDNEFGKDMALSGIQTIATFTIACSNKQRLTVRALPAVTKDEPYFSASLKILTKIAVRDVFAKK